MELILIHLLKVTTFHLVFLFLADLFGRKWVNISSKHYKIEIDSCKKPIKKILPEPKIFFYGLIIYIFIFYALSLLIDHLSIKSIGSMFLIIMVSFSFVWLIFPSIQFNLPVKKSDEKKA